MDGGWSCSPVRGSGVMWWQGDAEIVLEKEGVENGEIIARDGGDEGVDKQVTSGAPGKDITGI